MLRVGDRVTYDGAAHEVVALSGTAVRLQAATSGQTCVVTLPFLLASPGFAIMGAAPARRLDPVGLLSGLPASAIDAARRWERHIVEVETGSPGGPPSGGPLGRTTTRTGGR